MNREQSFGLLIDAVMLAIEARLVDDIGKTTKALEEWTDLALNKDNEIIGSHIVPDWESAPEWATHFAIDTDSSAFWYEGEPIYNEQSGDWECSSGDSRVLLAVFNYLLAKDSLQKGSSNGQSK